MMRTDVGLLSSLSSHLLLFVLLLVTRDDVINTEQQNGRLQTQQYNQYQSHY